MRFVALILGFMLLEPVAYPQKKGSVISESQKESKKNALRFIVFGDWGRNGEDNQKETALEMGAVAKSFDPAFIISTGDNFYPNGVRSTMDHNWIASFENIYTAHSLQRDWWVVLGNHDYKGSTQAEIDYTNVDRKWNMPDRYFSKIFFIGGDSTKGVMFVFIDTTPLISEYYHGTDHSVRNQDTAMQRKWIEKTLGEAPAYVKWKFVVGHHPLWTGGGRMKAPESVEMKKLLRPIFEKYHVNAYICGHDHNLQYIKPDGFTHYFVSGAGSETARVMLHPEGGKFARSENGFMDFTITNDNMDVQVIGYHGEALYSTTISRE
jgi:tartrate-resistant acid phosphatase type 5